MSTPLLGGGYNFLRKSKSQWKKEGGGEGGQVWSKYCPFDNASSLFGISNSPARTATIASILISLWHISHPAQTTWFLSSYFSATSYYFSSTTSYYFDSFIIDSTSVPSILLPHRKMSHPAPDYSITFLLHFHLLSFTSVLHVPEGVVHQHFECWKGFGLSFQSPFVGAVPQSVQQLLMRLWHFCVSFMTDIKLKPCAIRLYWTFQMFISPESERSETRETSLKCFGRQQEILTHKNCSSW